MGTLVLSHSLACSLSSSPHLGNLTRTQRCFSLSGVLSVSVRDRPTPPRGAVGSVWRPFELSKLSEGVEEGVPRHRWGRDQRCRADPRDGPAEGAARPCTLVVSVPRAMGGGRLGWEHFDVTADKVSGGLHKPSAVLTFSSHSPPQEDLQIVPFDRCGLCPSPCRGGKAEEEVGEGGSVPERRHGCSWHF